MNNPHVTEFLRKYKLQNPVKYKQKYGDVPPEEAVLNTGNPQPIGTVKVELGEKKPETVEQTFTPVESFTPVVEAEEAPVAPEKPKRGRKPKNG